MTQPRGPTIASDAALNLALANWEVPSVHASTQLFAHTAALAKTPVLEAERSRMMRRMCSTNADALAT